MIRRQSNGPVNINTGGGGLQGQQWVVAVPRFRPGPVLDINFDVQAAEFIPYGQYNMSGKGVGSG